MSTNTIKRGIISLTNDDSKDIAYCQVNYLEKTSNAEAIYPYGYGANAPINTISILVPVNGNEANLAAFPYSQQERFKNLKVGEVVIGNPSSGSYIKFLENGDIEIYTKGKVNINSQEVNGSGKFNLGSGGAAIARLGDQVTVGSNTGTITSASTNNKSN